MPKKYYVNDVNRLLNISTRTLKYYEEVGLINPVKNDQDYRIYSNNDLIKISKILSLQMGGFTLKHIPENPTQFDDLDYDSYLDYLNHEISKFQIMKCLNERLKDKNNSLYVYYKPYNESLLCQKNVQFIDEKDFIDFVDNSIDKGLVVTYKYFNCVDNAFPKEVMLYDFDKISLDIDAELGAESNNCFVLCTLFYSKSFDFKEIVNNMFSYLKFDDSFNFNIKENVFVKFIDKDENGEYLCEVNVPFSISIKYDKANLQSYGLKGKKY